MTRISQRCQYALRTVFELTRRRGSGPVSARDIAARQAIPHRFLQLILRELRNAGIVESHRGARGGYTLAVDPRHLTVGSVIHRFDGTLDPVDCTGCGGKRHCPLAGRCAFAGLWRQARDAVTALYFSTTFQQLLERETSEQGPTEGGRR